MLHALPHRTHGGQDPIQRTVESALRNAGILIFTLVALMILLLGVFATRAT